MKKLMALLLALTMLIGLLAGCGTNSEQGNNETKVQNENADGEKTKITIGIRENTLVEDYETNAYKLWLEEQTGYEIEFQLFASGGNDAATQLSVMLVNDNEKLPDMLMCFNTLAATTWRMYGEDGYFISLSEFFDDVDGVAKPWYDRMEEVGASDSYVQQVLKACSGSDGEIYAYPTVEFGSLDNQDYAVHLNKTWLDELGLDIPSDPESLYEVLKAIKAAHPDSFPLVGQKTTAGSGDVVSWLLNMFLYSDDTKYLNVSDDGKTLYTNFTSDEYREGLEYCNKLYSEGLLSIVTSNELKAMVNVDDEDMKVGCFVGHPTLIFEANHPSLYNYVACPIWGNAVVNDNARRNETFITMAAEENGTVEACWNLLMVMVSKESAYRQRYGVLGTDWDWADEGTKSLTGEDAEIKVINQAAFSSLGNNTLHVVSSTLLCNGENEATQLSDDLTEWDAYKYELQGEQWKSFYAAAEKNSPKYTYPIVTLTDDERDEISDITTNCKNWIQEYRTNFVSGANNLNPSNDADWAAYLKGLEDCGLSQWLELYQEVYTSRYYDIVVGG